MEDFVEIWPLKLVRGGGGGRDSQPSLAKFCMLNSSVPGEQLENSQEIILSLFFNRFRCRWRNSKDLLKWDVLIGCLNEADPIRGAVRLRNMGMYA